jgi:hypothetical protein
MKYDRFHSLHDRTTDRKDVASPNPTAFNIESPDENPVVSDRNAVERVGTPRDAHPAAFDRPMISNS